MRIGILGSGLMRGKLGTLFARAGHDVVFSYARSEQKLRRLARAAQANARAGTPREAAREADALLLAVHWSRGEVTVARGSEDGVDDFTPDGGARPERARGRLAGAGLGDRRCRAP